MFASWILAAAAAAQLLPIIIPLQRPPPHPAERIAPIEISGPEFAARCKDGDAFDKPAPPVGICGNPYLGGTCGISSILITDPAGDILIDGGTEDDADLIAANIKSLGFRLSDIKYILHSHEHFDHVGGIARLQQLSGAQLFASPAAAKVFETGTAGSGDPQAGMHKPFPSAKVDRVLRDGEQVRLGNLMLTALATPGHTPGALSWTWLSCDGGVCRQIVYADSLSPVSRDDYRFSDHPQYLAAYRASITRIAALECDILLTPHPSASKMADRLAKKSLEDMDGCKTYAADLTKRLDERLAKEAAPK